MKGESKEDNNDLDGSNSNIDLKEEEDEDERPVSYPIHKFMIDKKQEKEEMKVKPSANVHVKINNEDEVARKNKEQLEVKQIEIKSQEQLSNQPSSNHFSQNDAFAQNLQDQKIEEGKEIKRENEAVEKIEEEDAEQNKEEQNEKEQEVKVEHQNEERKQGEEEEEDILIEKESNKNRDFLIKNEESNEEIEKQKTELRQALAQMSSQLDQSYCSIMSVENKKKKRRDEASKETLNEDFLSHIKILNPYFDPKKVKHENLSELLMFTYNPSTLPQEFDKIFEKTIINYLDFPSEYNKIPRVQELSEDEIEVRQQSLYDLSYETFCYTHYSDMDKFLNKAFTNLNQIVNQDKSVRISENEPFKEILFQEDLFKTVNQVNKSDPNFFVIYNFRDQKTMVKVVNESNLISSERYRSLSLLSKQPIFFFFYEYFKSIWGNKPHLIASSLNSNPITKHYDFTARLSEKLDWISKMKNKKKFTYLNENSFPTMHQFKGSNSEINEQNKYFEDDKKKDKNMNIEEEPASIESEEDFEKAVERKEKDPSKSFAKPSKMIFKNMNRSLSNFFSKNETPNTNNKNEYRKGILEYAKAIKKTQFPIENKDEGNGKSIDYSSYTKMVKVEDVKSLITITRQNSNSLHAYQNNRQQSRKKIISDQNGGELQNIISYLKNSFVGMEQQQQGNMGDMSQMRSMPQNMQMRHPMMNRQGNMIVNSGGGQYHPQYQQNSNMQGQPTQRPIQGYTEQQGLPVNGIPIMSQGHMHQTQNMPPQNMMMPIQRGPIPQHGISPSQIPHERGVPQGPPQLQHTNSQGQPPPYGGQQQTNGQMHHQYLPHPSMQGSTQNQQQGGNPPPPNQMHQMPIHGQIPNQGIHHIPPGQGIPPNGTQPVNYNQGQNHGYPNSVSPAMAPSGMPQNKQLLHNQPPYTNQGPVQGMNGMIQGGMQVPMQGGMPPSVTQPVHQNQDQIQGNQKTKKSDDQQSPVRKGSKKIVTQNPTGEAEGDKQKKTKKKKGAEEVPNV